MLYHNSTCRYFWTYPIIAQTGELKKSIERFNPKKYIKVVQNFEEFAFKALACPYFSQYGMVSGEMVSLAENRRDFHVVVDTPDITPSAVVNWRTSGNHNSKFESIYYPWLMKLDTYTKKVVPVPASGSALQAMAPAGRTAATPRAN